MPAADWPVAVDHWFGCWRWKKSRNSNGYGTAWTKAGPRTAHEYVWERETGNPVPPGKVLDHVACRRRDCVNPTHLEVVSQNENMRRVHWAHRSQLTRCAKDHDLTVHGRRTPEGGLVCRICSHVWQPPGPEPELE